MEDFSDATLLIEQLDLDIENPRFKAESNQTDAMRSLLMVEKDGEKVFELASDICRIGRLDPAEKLFVIKSETDVGRYTVLDGNRRLTALRLLSQPALLERDELEINQTIRNRFKRLQTEYAGRWPISVNAVIAKDRDTAKHFIHLRHTGENAGAGRSAWSALQIARFDNTGTWQCLESLRSSGKLNLEVMNRIDVSSFEITNFERVVLKKEFQTTFGFSITGNSFKYVDQNRAEIALAIVADDVVSQRVHTRGEFETVEKMKGYFAEVEAKVNAALEQKKSDEARQGGRESKTGDASSTAGGSANNQDSGATQGQNDPNPTSSGDGSSNQTTRKPRKRKYVADKSDITSITNQKCHAIFRELREGVAVEDAPYACALLIRSLLEITCEVYVKEVMRESANSNTGYITAASGHILDMKKSMPCDPPDRQSIVESFKASKDCYAQLSTAAHNPHNEISPEHVKTTWHSMRGGLDILWKRIAHKQAEQMKARIESLKQNGQTE